MSGEISTIQSLQAVDAWIDVINANINGGVRTAFKSSRLKFSGSNTNVVSSGNSTALPLQFPESSLTTANTVIDFTQGAITASTENSHLALQGDGFFLLASPDMIDTNPASATFGCTKPLATAKMLLTRDGEFHTDQNGFLVDRAGYFLVTCSLRDVSGERVIRYDTTSEFGTTSGLRTVFNNLDIPTVPTAGSFVPLTSYMQNTYPCTDNNGLTVGCTGALLVKTGEQSLQYSTFGSTVFDFGFKAQATHGPGQFSQSLKITHSQDVGTTVLNKSLEASNSSMTQSVPELSLAQKLFSALTKVLQTKQTNVDGVLNLVR